MKAVINLDVPDWQIGKVVSVYFPDSMVKHGTCEKDEIVWCKDCKYFNVIEWSDFHKKLWPKDGPESYDCMHLDMETNGPEWFCADGRRKENG